MRQRQRSGITGPNGALLEYPLSTAQFIAPLKNTLAPSAGYGPATFTRTTTASCFDNEGMLKEVRAGAARFTGARMVANIIPYSENDPGWTAAGTTPPTVSTDVAYNGRTCSSATFASGLSGYSATRVGSTSYTITTGRTYAMRFLIAFDRPLVPTESVLIVCTGSAGAVNSISSTSSSNVVTTSLTALTPANVTATGSGSNSLFIYPNGNLLSPLTVYITEKQMEDVTGQTDQTISEYVHSGKIRSNYLTYTEDFTISPWNATNTTITQNQIANPINGLVNVTKVSATATAAASFYTQTVSAGSASGMTFMIYGKKGSGTNDCNRLVIYNVTSATSIVNTTINWDTGVMADTVNSDATDIGNGWFRIRLFSATGFSLGDTVRVYIGWSGGTETAGDYAYFYGPTLVRGVVAIPTYTEVGADYDPHGSGVDGVKYFNTNKDGTPIPSTYLKGYLNEGGGTNKLLRSRNWTVAPWVRVNMAADITPVGLDGTVGNATVLAATAGNATCLQTITTAAAVRTFSVYIQRVIGSGAISITRDNGASWTDVTALITTAGYTRVSIDGTSVLNPTCGIRLTTSGDAVNVDFGQDEFGAFPSNPILTTTVSVTRNQDKLSYGGAGNYAVATGTCLVNFSSQETASTYSNKNTVVSAGSARPIYIENGDAIANTGIWDGTAGTSSNGASRASGTLRKGCANWQATTMKVIGEGAIGTPASNTFTGTMGNTLAVYVGIQDSAGNSPLFGNIKDLYVWPTALTDNQMRQIVA